MAMKRPAAARMSYFDQCVAKQKKEEEASGSGAKKAKLEHDEGGAPPAMKLEDSLAIGVYFVVPCRCCLIKVL
eukprot:1554747-Alexandrium_andersonii.AAC.1